jgi:type I protein arginine methyltransferase
VSSLRTCIVNPETRLPRQTVFYTIDPISVLNGDFIEGTVSCAPNARNNRDLDIVIEYKLDASATDGGQGRQSEDRIEYKMYVIFLLSLFCVDRD